MLAISADDASHFPREIQRVAVPESADHKSGNHVDISVQRGEQQRLHLHWRVDFNLVSVFLLRPTNFLEFGFPMSGIALSVSRAKSDKLTREARLLVRVFAPQSLPSLLF